LNESTTFSQCMPVSQYGYVFSLVVNECVPLDSGRSTMMYCTPQELTVRTFASADCSGPADTDELLDITEAMGDPALANDCMVVRSCPGYDITTTTTPAPVTPAPTTPAPTTAAPITAAPITTTSTSSTSTTTTTSTSTTYSPAPTYADGYPFVLDQGAGQCGAVFVVSDSDTYPIGTAWPLGECTSYGVIWASSAWNCIDGVAHYQVYYGPNCEGSPVNSIPAEGELYMYSCDAERTCDSSSFTISTAEMCTCTESGTGCQNIKTSYAVNECLVLDADLSVTTFCTGESFFYKYFASDDCSGSVISEERVGAAMKAANPHSYTFSDDCLVMEECPDGNMFDARAAWDVDRDTRGQVPAAEATWAETLEAHSVAMTLMALLVLGVVCACCVWCAWCMAKQDAGYGPVKQAYNV